MRLGAGVERWDEARLIGWVSMTVEGGRVGGRGKETWVWNGSDGR